MYKQLPLYKKRTDWASRDLAHLQTGKPVEIMIHQRTEWISTAWTQGQILIFPYSMCRTSYPTKDHQLRSYSFLTLSLICNKPTHNFPELEIVVFFR